MATCNTGVTSPKFAFRNGLLNTDEIRRSLKAVHDDDLRALLTELGVVRDFERGVIKCKFCGSVVSWETLHALFPESGSIKLACTRPACVGALMERPQR